MNIFKKIGDFFLCMLRENCEYSIKKFLSYVFSGLVIYMAVFTNKDFYEILMFVAVLLGIRSYERLRAPKPDGTPSENSGEAPLLAKKKVLTD